MSNIDLEVLYLILTKVAAKETFYNYDPSHLAPGALPGTITKRQLAEIYERITGLRIGATLNWNVPIGQLNQLLSRCKLPSLGPLIADAEASLKLGSDHLSKAQATKWPPFSALKNLYRKGK